MKSCRSVIFGMKMRRSSNSGICRCQICEYWKPTEIIFHAEARYPPQYTQYFPTDLWKVERKGWNYSEIRRSDTDRYTVEAEMHILDSILAAADSCFASSEDSCRRVLFRNWRFYVPFFSRSDTAMSPGWFRKWTDLIRALADLWRKKLKMSDFFSALTKE